MSIRAVLYARVSGDDYDDDLSKLDHQIAEYRKYAEEKGYTVVAEFQEPKYSSGAKIDLPERTKVLDLARDHAFDVLVTRSIKRFCRQTDRYYEIRAILRVHGVVFDFLEREYPDDYNGEFQETIDVGLAQLERNQIRERTVRGKRNSVKAGNVTCCGAPPYGYREAISQDGKRTLAIHEEEAEVVRTIFRLYLDGNGNGKKFGCKGIAKYLTERNIPSHSEKGNTINNKAVSDYGAWVHHPVMRMLKSPVYRGEWQYGKRTDNPITIPVPRIVTDEDWEAAQVIRKKNRKVRKYSGDYDYLLQGITYCAACTSPMRTKMNRSKTASYSYYTHRWTAHHHNGSGAHCSVHGDYRADVVDDAVWAYTKEILSNPDELAGGFRKYAERLKSDNNPTRDKRDTAQKQVDSTERELSRLVHLYMKDKITETQYDEMKKPLDVALKHHADEVAALSQELEQSVKLEDHMQSITKFAEVAAAKLNTKYAAKIENRREVVRRMGLQVELGGDNKKRYADVVFISPEFVTLKCTLRRARTLRV